jgi:hypothetical protein
VSLPCTVDFSSQQFTFQNYVFVYRTAWHNIGDFITIKIYFMTDPKDRHLDTPGEANRDKHINFLAEENGDVDPADENFDNDDDTDEDDESGDDNGFFTDDDNKLQTKEEYEEDKGNRPGKNEKVTPVELDETTQTLGDRISVNSNNSDILTLVVDDDRTDPDKNENDQPR